VSTGLTAGGMTATKPEKRAEGERGCSSRARAPVTPSPPPPPARPPSTVPHRGSGRRCPGRSSSGRGTGTCPSPRTSVLEQKTKKKKTET
jgi:hypothetical protein